MKHSNYVRLHGRLRTPQDVRSELTLLLDMIAELDCTAVTTRPQAHPHASR